MSPAPSAVRAGKAYVELGISDKMAAGLRRASARLRAFAAGVQQIGRQLLRLGAVMAAPLAAGTKVFADFQERMAEVSTMLDEPERHMATFTHAVRQMSVQFGESTETLARGLYDILSASIAPAKALDVLAVSAKAARAGLTDTGVAADALTTVLNAYGLGAERAADVSDLLFSIVKRGKTRFGELAPSIGLVASTAASANVSLEELGAGIATLTRAGIRTENAVTAVNRVIASFLKPTKESADAARALGFQMNTATLASEGLAGVFQRISKLPKEAIAELFPNIRALRGVIPALQRLEGFLGDIQIMAGRAGATGIAYQKMTNTITHSMRQMGRAALNALSAIGEALADSAQDLAAWGREALGALADWIERNRGLVVSAAKLAATVLAAGAGLLLLGVAARGLAVVFALAAKAFPDLLL